MVRVEDAQAHCERAREHGAHILMEPTDMEFGERQYSAGPGMAPAPQTPRGLRVVGGKAGSSPTPTSEAEPNRRQGPQRSLTMQPHRVIPVRRDSLSEAAPVVSASRIAGTKDHLMRI
jgi:hypothetical protein